MTVEQRGHERDNDKTKKKTWQGSPGGKAMTIKEIYEIMGGIAWLV